MHKLTVSCKNWPFWCKNWPFRAFLDRYNNWLYLGHKKNSAQASLVSTVAKVRGTYKVIGSTVVKKQQEIPDETLRKHGKGFIAEKGTCSSQLEKIGTREQVEHTILPMCIELPNHNILISSDADVPKHLSSINVYVDTEKKGQEMIPAKKIIFQADIAHILKNIWGTFVRHFKTGSAADKFNKKQMLQFHRRVRSAIAEIIAKLSSGEWTLANAMKKMEKTIKHAYGNHEDCDSNCPKMPGIFQEHGKLTFKIIAEKLHAFMDCHFGEKYIKSLLYTGTTSPVEYLHSTLIRRRLWVKGTQSTARDQRYEVATSMTILIYNEGQDSAFRQILQKLEYKVPEVGLIRIEKEEKARKALCEAKLAKKNEILNKRRQSQKQFAQLGSYASQAQRDIDNARQSFIVEREKNDDDLPDFNELEGPPDESEDEEIEAEIEDWFKILKNVNIILNKPKTNNSDQ